MEKLLPIMLKLALIHLHLTLIHSELVNIALNKATRTMTLDRETNGGQEAVDGSTNDVNCTSLVSFNNTVSWLRIDLEMTTKAHIIVIHPRSQSSSNLTWNTTQVYMSHRPELTSYPDDEGLCNLFSSTVTSTVNATCTNRGRFVFVTNIDNLYVCEVLVYVCTNGSYGPDCSQRCGYCGGGSCDAETGVCGGGGCKEGYSGTDCNIHRPDSGMSTAVAGVIGAIIMLLLIIAVVAAIFFWFYCRVRKNTSAAATINRRPSEARSNNNQQGILSRSYARFTSLFKTSRDSTVVVDQTRPKSIDRQSTQEEQPQNNVYVHNSPVTDEPGVTVNEPGVSNVGPTDPVVQSGVDNCAFEVEDSDMYEEPLPDPSGESEYFPMGGENKADQVYENQGSERDEDDQPVYEAMEIPGDKGIELVAFNMHSEADEKDHTNIDGEC